MNILRVPAAYAREAEAVLHDLKARIERDQRLRAAGLDERTLARESDVAVFMVDPEIEGDCVIIVALPNDDEGAVSHPLPAPIALLSAVA